MREATRRAWARWLRVLEGEARTAIEAGELPPDRDPAQIAFELNGIGMALNNALQLHDDRAGVERARRAFGRVLAP